MSRPLRRKIDVKPVMPPYEGPINDHRRAVRIRCRRSRYPDSQGLGQRVRARADGQGRDGSYEGMLFDLAEPLDYVIEAAGVRSASHKLNVVELPYARRSLSNTLSVIHRPRSAQDRRRRRHRRAEGTNVSSRDADDGDQGRALVLGEKETVPSGGESGRHVSANLRRSTTASTASTRFARRRAADRIAAIHVDL